jgi:hypothetical protein
VLYSQIRGRFEIDGLLKMMMKINVAIQIIHEDCTSRLKLLSILVVRLHLSLKACFTSGRDTELDRPCLRCSVLVS